MMMISIRLYHSLYAWFFVYPGAVIVTRLPLYTDFQTSSEHVTILRSCIALISYVFTYVQAYL